MYSFQNILPLDSIIHRIILCHCALLNSNQSYRDDTASSREDLRPCILESYSVTDVAHSVTKGSKKHYRMCHIVLQSMADSATE